MADIQSSDNHLVADSTTDTMQALVKCPYCHGADLIKYGKTRGTCRQKYRCRAAGCRRQFAAGSDWQIEPRIKALIIEQLSIGWKPPKIARDLNVGGRSVISLRWIYALRQRMKERLADQLEVLTDKRPDPKTKAIVVNMINAGLKRSQIKKFMGDEVSLEYITGLRRKRKYEHD